MLMKIRSEDIKFLSFAIAILVLPILITRAAFLDIFNFSTTGQVGDTIGGITAPFVGLVSAYLIYKAFVVQVEANKIQSRNNEFTIALKLIDDLEERFNNENNPYEYTTTIGPTTKTDKARFFEIVRFYDGIKVYRVHYTQMIILMIRQVEYFKKYVNRSRNLSDNDKMLLMEKASLTFGNDLYNAFDTMLKVVPGDLKEQDQQFYSYCKKFYDTTLQDFLFHLISY